MDKRYHSCLRVAIVVIVIFTTQSISSSLAESVDITFSRNNEDANDITVRCDVFSTPPPASVTFVVSHPDGSSSSNDMSPVMISNGIHSAAYNFVLTPSNESSVYCQLPNGGPRSSMLTLAAQPATNNQEQMFTQFMGEVQLLKCPLELGRAHEVIEPYHYVWFDGNNVEIQMEQSQTYNLDVTESQRYTCALRLRLCNSSNCRSADLPAIGNRPSFLITAIECPNIITIPSNMSVEEGFPVTFNCTASGSEIQNSEIQIMWDYNGTVFTDENITSDFNITTHPNRDGIHSTFTVISPRPSNSIPVTCILYRSLNSLVKNTTGIGYLTVTPMPTTSPSPSLTTSTTTSTTTLSPTTSPMATQTPPTSSNDVTTIAVVCLGIAAVIAVTVFTIVIVVITCHYHYKYKENSKIGRTAGFLVRAMSRNTRNNINPEANVLPSRNGQVLDTCFRAGDGDSVPTVQPHNVHSQEQQELIYNTSQYSKSSGGSYSGLSGVSNQEPGAVYKMPEYNGTDVSGGSVNPSSTVTNGSTHLAPPNYNNGSSRSRRSSDGSNHSHCDNPHPNVQFKLTRELVEQLPHQRALSYQNVNVPQSHGGYPSCHPQNYHPQYHSDNGLHYRHHSVPASLLPVHSPATATVSTNAPYIPEHTAPFPNTRTPDTQEVPFPNKQSNEGQRISEDTIEKVVQCLMHNKNCRIHNCPCHRVKEAYKMRASATHPTQPRKQLSNSSDSSESAFERRKGLHLPVGGDDPKLHPHFHRGKKNLVRSLNPKPKLRRTRSKSLDLSPREEFSVSPAKTPKVGACLVAGTPVCARTLEDGLDEENRNPSFQFTDASPLAAQYAACVPDCLDGKLGHGSMSADNIPTLCLNDCPFTPRADVRLLNPSMKRPTSGKPILSPIGENHDTDESDTSTHSQSSPELAKTSSSDHDADSAHGGSISNSTISHGHSSMGLVHWNTIEETPRETARELSNGYHSETLSSVTNVSKYNKLTPKVQQNKYDSNHSLRSNSPAYETITQISDDGSTLQITEC